MWVNLYALQNVTGKAKTKGLFSTIKRLNIYQKFTACIRGSTEDCKCYI